MFVKGQSGNPSGRPKEDANLKALVRSHTPKAIQTLVDIMQSKKSPAAARVSAANALLDRGYGKPAQQIDGHLEFAGYERIPIPVPVRNSDSLDTAAGPTGNGHTAG